MLKNSKKNNKNFKQKRMLVIALLFIVIAAGVYLSYNKILLVSYTFNQAKMNTFREMVISANANLKKDAPIDAKTGDIYFPEAKLFLPNDAYGKPRLLYEFDPAGNGGGDQLSVSDKNLVNFKSANLYNAQNINHMMEMVPILQACQRGVSVGFSEPTIDSGDAPEIKKTISINNGKTIYLSYEKACPELEELVNTLTKLKSY